VGVDDEPAPGVDDEPPGVDDEPAPGVDVVGSVEATPPRATSGELPPLAGPGALAPLAAGGGSPLEGCSDRPPHAPLANRTPAHTPRKIARPGLVTCMVHK